jgi:excisionase family DNA binding protein
LSIPQLEIKKPSNITYLQLLTVPEAAKVLSVAQAKVSEWIKAGRLQAVNVANQGKRPQYRIPREALANLQEPIKYKPKHL